MSGFNVPVIGNYMAYSDQLFQNVTKIIRIGPA